MRIKKKLEEVHKCDNSCRLYNLCCFSGRYGKKISKIFLRPSDFEVQGNIFSPTTTPNEMEEDLRDGWMNG